MLEEEEGGTLARKVGEVVTNTLGAVATAIDIPLGEWGRKRTTTQNRVTQLGFCDTSESGPHRTNSALQWLLAAQAKLRAWGGQVLHSFFIGADGRSAGR